MGFGAVQTLVGVTKLSELGIDVSKDWLSYQIKNLSDPTTAQDAATRAYVLAQLLSYLALAGGTMSGAIAMGTNKITGMGDPTAAQDAATKAYADTKLANVVEDTSPELGGNLDALTRLINNLGAPVASADAARKSEVDTVQALLDDITYSGDTISFDTIYQNTSGKIQLLTLWFYAYLESTDGTLEGYAYATLLIGVSASPGNYADRSGIYSSVIKGLTATTNRLKVACSVQAIIPPNWYYELETAKSLDGDFETLARRVYTLH